MEYSKTLDKRILTFKCQDSLVRCFGNYQKGISTMKDNTGDQKEFWNSNLNCPGLWQKRRARFGPRALRPFVPWMKNDDFSNFHLFINLQPQPARRPAQKRPFFARASRTVFTEIIISAFFAPLPPLLLLLVRLITIFPLFVLRFHRFTDCQQKCFLTSFGDLSLFLFSEILVRFVFMQWILSSYHLLVSKSVLLVIFIWVTYCKILLYL